MTINRWNAKIVMALVLVGGFFVIDAHAVVVLFKDGYTLHGNSIIKEKAPLIDKAAGDIFVIDKPNGMTFIDDGARWTIFPTTSAQLADVSETNKYKDFTGYSPKGERNRGTTKLAPTATRPEIVKDWDPVEWTREVKLQDSEDRGIFYRLKQHISVITPYYMRIGSSTYSVVQYFLTKEFPTPLVRTFLSNHPDIKETSGKVDPVKRERLIRFWIQGDYLEEADADVEKFATDAGAEHKEKVQALRAEVGGMRATKLLAEIEFARDAGRHQWAIRALALFPKQDVPKAVQEKVTVLRAEYETRVAKFDLAKRLLQNLPTNLKPEHRFLVDAAATVLSELHLDTLSRLEVFTTLSERAEADTKNGRKPTHQPEDLLAAAVTGWHLGKVAAETKVETARRCWATRLMALTYLRDEHQRNRLDAVNGYLKNTDALPYDEVEKLVSLLIPPMAPEKITPGPTTVPLPRAGEMTAATKFIVRLPEEYQPGRSYPLIVLMPDGFEKPADLLAKFDAAAKMGYITAVLYWADPDDNKYNFKVEERAMITELIRTLRRMYQVDSDRIYIGGNGHGATMALDYASGHPDMFAGVIPFNPIVHQKLFITMQYWVNFAQLPVYITMGDTSGPSVTAIRAVGEKWMPQGFPTLITAYKGRGVEWFPHELTYLFDWMGRKKRAEAGRTLGPPALGTVQKPGFSSARASDNRFHWLSIDEFWPGNIRNEPNNTYPNAAAKIAANLLEGNRIDVKQIGVNELTIWFGKGMCDYTKPVNITVSNVSKPIKKQITPQIRVLMEDLYERGDRQRPYFEKENIRIVK